MAVINELFLASSSVRIYLSFTNILAYLAVATNTTHEHGTLLLSATSTAPTRESTARVPCYSKDHRRENNAHRCGTTERVVVTSVSYPY